MPDVNRYIVRKPVLWFEAIGMTAPDAPLDFPDNGLVVYRSSLARPGDILHSIEGTLVHESPDGKLSRGALRIGSANLEQGDAIRLVMSGSIAPDPCVSTPNMPDVPEAVYPSHHAGIERDAVSPAFAAMMDGTEALRLECYEDGEWSVICGDYGVKRTVTFAVADAETALPLIYVEHDPATDVADITVVNHVENGIIVGALASEGISMEGKGTVRICGWSTSYWEAVQSALQETLFENRRVRPMAMAI